MKTTINFNELKRLGACSEGYEVFIKTHGDKTVKFSEALASNGWGDIWWLLCRAYIAGDLSDSQDRDLRLLGCDYAEDVLHVYEKKYNDSHPRNAIQTSRKFAIGKAVEEEMRSSRSSCVIAARTAAWNGAIDSKDTISSAAAYAAASTTSWEAWNASLTAATRAIETVVTHAAKDDKREWQTEKLMDLFLTWEKEKCTQ